MSKRELSRVVFFSKEDLSVGHYLQKVEALLNATDTDRLSEVNDLLELHHVKQYFDHGFFLLTWDEQIKNRYQEQVLKAETLTKKFFLTINDDNLLAIVESLEFNYRRSFWHLFNFLQIFTKINGDVMTEVLTKYPVNIRYVLSQFKTVGHFDAILRQYLLTYEKAAELLLSKFEQGGANRTNSYFFPKSLSLTDKEDIISSYIDFEDANLNYIRLIEHSKESNDLKLSARTRLRAKQKSEALNTKILDEGAGIKTGIEISLKKDQVEPFAVTQNGQVLEISYSEQFLDQQPNDIRLFLLFRDFFALTDHNGLITLVAKACEMDVIESLVMTSKNEYPAGMKFLHKNYIAFMQVMLLADYLHRKEKSMEEVIQSFVQLVLNEQLGLGNLQFRIPTPSATYLEKIRTVAPELEFVLSQYQVYSQDGRIDFELIRLDSTPLRLDDIKSLLERKYAYIEGDNAQRLKHLFFSDQSPFNYVEAYDEQYSTFYDLLQNENVQLDQFVNYQRELIEILVSEDHLYFDEENCVKIKDDVFIYLIGELYRNEVISYWHFPPEVRGVMDAMEKEGYLRFGNSLFTQQEIYYFNYYLNRKGYTNGMNIRNKYAHGSNSESEEKHRDEYWVLLTLVIISFLKILDDLMLHKKVIAEKV